MRKNIQDLRPDHFLPVTLEAKGKEDDLQEFAANAREPLRIENVPCKIYLPRKKSGHARLHFYLTDEQAEIIGVLGNYFWRFELRGEKARSGSQASEGKQPRLRVRCEVAYIDKWPMWGGNDDFQEIIAEAHPADLEIEEILGPEHNTKRKIKGQFWLSPNKCLDNLSARPKHDIYLYITSGREPFRFRLQLPNDSTSSPRSRAIPIVSLAQQIETYRNEDGDTVLMREQTMPFELTAAERRRHGVDQVLVQAVDDFTLLASIATRWPTICLGWNLWDEWRIITHYRGSQSRPSPERVRWEEDPIHNGLLDDRKVERFIRHAYDFLLGLEDADRILIRQVLQRLLTGYGRQIESAFVALYAALEMLVLRFRRENQMETLFAPDDWKQFEKDLRKYLKSHEMLANDRIRRQRVGEKVPELNRVAFGSAFRAFCNAPEHSVVVSDLWPLTGKGSLSELRNELVHGVPFSPPRRRALTTATDHLQWCLERMVLAVMQWPLEDSFVHADILSDQVSYIDWRRDQALLEIG